MNNIIVSREKKLKLNDCIVNLEIKTDKLDIYISGEVVLNEFLPKKKKLVLSIYLEEDSHLEYNKFAILEDYDLDINIYQKSNSDSTLNYSFIAKSLVNMKINTILESDSNNSKVIIRGVSEEKGTIKIEATGSVYPMTKDNNLTEDIRLLVLGDNSCTVIPNMLINTDEVEANHFVSIGCVPKEELFYLSSKGIGSKQGTKLIKNGFLINNLKLNNEFMIKIKEKLNEGGGKSDES